MSQPGGCKHGPLSTPAVVVSARPSAARRHEISRGCSNPEVVYRASVRCRTHLFSTDSDCLKLSQSISVEFHRGGTKPEVVFRIGSRCRRHVSWIDVDHLRLAESLDTSSTALENYFRFGAATLEFHTNRVAEPPTVPIRRRTTSRTPANARKRHYLL